MSTEAHPSTSNNRDKSRIARPKLWDTTLKITIPLFRKISEQTQWFCTGAWHGTRESNKKDKESRPSDIRRVPFDK
ncbi:hypothetical protein JCM5350_008356 [Sporobolomyces pararoseus]